MVTKKAELLLYLYAESPVHAGASDALDVIDLPVQREASTTYPVIWGQSLKGALRQAAGDAGWDHTTVKTVFGREIDDAAAGELESGLLSVGDAQLVAMPVPTLRRTFAWVTSQLALSRLARKYTFAGHRVPGQPTVADDRGLAADAKWISPGGQVLGPCVLPLEDTVSPELRSWAELLAHDAIGAGPGLADFGAKLETDLLLVGSDAMPMLLRECTELTPRVQLNEGKTVKHGPFYSEYLPTETILVAALTLRAGVKAAATEFDEHLKAVRDLLGDKPNLLQVGGDETLGKGLVWTRLVEAVRE
ncbi:MAG: type III-B CRISPR module RAMP protein Cmr4 [Streptomycetales bacterium]